MAYKHRNDKIAFGQLYRDHRQMLTDSLRASCISGLVALNLDSTAVSKEMDIMSRFLVTETHASITTRAFTPRNRSPYQEKTVALNAVRTPG